MFLTLRTRRVLCLGLCLLFAACGGGGGGGNGGGDGGGGNGGAGGGNNTPNQGPTADAAADQAVQEGDTVTLDGSSSSDPEGDDLTFSWTQVAGPAVTLSDAGVAQPQFTAPAVSGGESEATLGFELVVNDGSSSSAADSVTVTVHLPTLVNFDPGAGTLAPTNYYFTGSTDGTLNIPGGDYDDNLNLLDGYSTITPARIDFAGKLDRESVAAGDNVRVFAVIIDSDTREVKRIEGELEAGLHYTAEVSNLPVSVGSDELADNRLLIKPLLPLKASSGSGDATGYLVVVTNGLLDQNGFPVRANDVYEAVRGESSLSGGDYGEYEELRQQTAGWTALLEGYAATPGLDVDDVVVSWSFTTQSTTDSLLAVAEQAAPRLPLISVQRSDNESDSSTDVDVYSGRISLPLYVLNGTGERLWETDTANDAIDRVTRFDPMPDTRGQSSLSLFAAIPKGAQCTRPAGGWPVVVYVPPFSPVDPGGEDDLVAAFAPPGVYDIKSVADELGERCVASVSVDRSVSFDETYTVPEEADAYRQLVADLVELVNTLPSLDMDEDGDMDFDGDRIGVLGVSAGASMGLVLMAVEPLVKFGSFASPDAGIAKSLDGSLVRSGGLEDELEASFSAPKGSAAYENIVGIIQSGFDVYDPLNYLHLIDDRPVHLIEIYGDGLLSGKAGDGPGTDYTDDEGNYLNPGDLIIPPEVMNTRALAGQVVETAPLAGIEAVARVLGLTSATATIDNTGSGEPVRAIARFTRGHHLSGLVVTDIRGFGDIGVSTEWRNQQAEFLASGGLLLPVDTSGDAYVMQTAP